MFINTLQNIHSVENYGLIKPKKLNPEQVTVKNLNELCLYAKKLDTEKSAKYDAFIK